MVVSIDRPGRIVVGDIKQAMGWCVGQVGKERLIGMLANEVLCCVVDHILRVSLPFTQSLIALQCHLFAVSNQIGRVIAMSVNLIVIAQEHVETVLLRDSR